MTMNGRVVTKFQTFGITIFSHGMKVISKTIHRLAHRPVLPSGEIYVSIKPSLVYHDKEL